MKTIYIFLKGKCLCNSSFCVANQFLLIVVNFDSRNF